MSLHRSLRTTSGALNQHRNVLSRTERIAKLTEMEQFDAQKQSALGLVKVRSIKVRAGKKKKAETAGDAAAPGAAAPGAAPAAPAAPAAGAAAKKK